MAYNNSYLLTQALKVTKAHAKGGNSRPAETVLRQVYEELKKINEEIKSGGDE